MWEVTCKGRLFLILSVQSEKKRLREDRLSGNIDKWSLLLGLGNCVERGQNTEGWGIAPGRSKQAREGKRQDVCEGQSEEGGRH